MPGPAATLVVRFFGLAASTCISCVAVAEPITLVSARPDGAAGSAASQAVGMANDGTVLFSSAATDLVPGMNGSTNQVYVWRNGAVQLVSRAAGGGRSNGDATAFAISANGRIVAFGSTATDLIAGVTNPGGHRQLYLADVETGAMELVTHERSDPLRGSNGPVGRAKLSADGSVVAFDSSADDMSDELTFARQVFTWSRDGGIQLESATQWGVPVTGFSTLSAISDDARYVLFESTGRIVTGVTDGNFGFDGFLRDRVAGTTKLVTHHHDDPLRTSDNYDSRMADLSADGRHVLFESFSHSFVPGAGWPFENVFRWSRDTDKFELVSHANNAPSTSAGNLSSAIALSRDGKLVAYRSSATTIVPEPDDNDAYDVFVWSATTRKNALVSRRADGSAAGQGVPWTNYLRAVFSGDGRTIVFSTNAAEQSWTVPDMNVAADLFAYDVGSENVRPLTVAADGTRLANDASSVAAVSDDGESVLLTSLATDLSPAADGNAANDAFLYRCPALLIDGFED